MPKRKSILMGAFIIFIIGGITMFSLNHIEKKRTEAQQIQHEQERMALLIVNRYEDVKKIEFLDFEKNQMTGVWHSSTKVNDKYDVDISLWGFDGEIGLNDRPAEDGTYPTEKKQETDKTNLDGVTVKYYKK